MTDPNLPDRPLMHPLTYFRDIVQPLMLLLKKNDQSLPLIYACTTMMYHVVDYIAVERDKGPKVIRDDIIHRFPEFKFIYSLATAQKHSVVTNPVAKGLASKDIKPGKMLPALTTSGRLMLSAGRVILIRAPVVVNIDGNKVQISNLLTRCEIFLKKYLELPEATR